VEEDRRVQELMQKGLKELQMLKVGHIVFFGRARGGEGGVRQVINTVEGAAEMVLSRTVEIRSLRRPDNDVRGYWLMGACRDKRS
jgi:hypothetical protein